MSNTVEIGDKSPWGVFRAKLNAMWNAATPYQRHGPFGDLPQALNEFVAAMTCPPGEKKHALRPGLAPVKILRGKDLWGEINEVVSTIAPDLITQMREMGFTEHVASTVAIEQILAMALDYLIDEVRVYRNEEGFELDLGSGEVQMQLTEEPVNSPWTQAEDAVNAMSAEERAEFRAWLDEANPAGA